jgi:hypothetical protein
MASIIFIMGKLGFVLDELCSLVQLGGIVNLYRAVSKLVSKLRSALCRTRSAHLAHNSHSLL